MMYQSISNQIKQSRNQFCFKNWFNCAESIDCLT